METDEIKKIQKIYYTNSTRFANIRTFLALLRTCAIFVALSIYMKNKWILLVCSFIILFGMFEFYYLNKKIRDFDLDIKEDLYFKIIMIYSSIFVFIFFFLFLYPPFKHKKRIK